MDFTEVKSSQVHSVAYNPETKTLAVRFHGKSGPGSLYYYANVSPEKHADFMKAESKGKFLAQHVKDKHEFKKQKEDHH